MVANAADLKHNFAKLRPDNKDAFCSVDVLSDDHDTLLRPPSSSSLFFPIPLVALSYRL
jgi:hypothetical protein